MSDSVNLLTLGESNQKEFLSKIIVLYFSKENLTLLEAKFFFFPSIDEVIEHILVREIYPYHEKSFYKNNLDISFKHEIEKKRIYSTYLFFSPPYYKEVVEALEEVLIE